MCVCVCVCVCVARHPCVLLYVTATLWQNNLVHWPFLNVWCVCVFVRVCEGVCVCVHNYKTTHCHRVIQEGVGSESKDPSKQANTGNVRQT